MHQASTAVRARVRGVCSGLIAAHLRELIGVRASMSLPGVGETLDFSYSRGGEQRGIETLDEWNARFDHILEPLI